MMGRSDRHVEGHSSSNVPVNFAWPIQEGLWFLQFISFFSESHALLRNAVPNPKREMSQIRDRTIDGRDSEYHSTFMPLPMPPPAVRFFLCGNSSFSFIDDFHNRHDRRITLLINLLSFIRDHCWRILFTATRHHCACTNQKRNANLLTRALNFQIHAPFKSRCRLLVSVLGLIRRFHLILLGLPM